MGNPLRDDNSVPRLRHAMEVAVATTALGLIALAGVTLLLDEPDGARGAARGDDAVVPDEVLALVRSPLPAGEDWPLVSQRLLDVLATAGAEPPSPLLLRAVLAEDCACLEEQRALVAAGTARPRLHVTQVAVAPDSRRPSDPDLPARDVTLYVRVRPATLADLPPGDGGPPIVDLPADDLRAIPVTLELDLVRVDDRSPWQVVRWAERPEPVSELVPDLEPDEDTTDT